MNQNFSNITIQKGNKYYDCNFMRYSFEKGEIEGCTFEKCTFNKCCFFDEYDKEASFIDCIFGGCDFYSSEKKKKDNVDFYAKFRSMGFSKYDRTNKFKIEYKEISDRIREAFYIIEKLRDTENHYGIGTIFEYFCIEYLKVNYGEEYEFYSFEMLDKSICQRLNLSKVDNGIDIIGVKNNTFLLIQAKYRSLGYLNNSDLGTFYGQCLYLEKRGFDYGFNTIPIIITTANYVHNELSKLIKQNSMKILSFYDIIDFAEKYDFKKIFDEYLYGIRKNNSKINDKLEDDDNGRCFPIETKFSLP